MNQEITKAYLVEQYVDYVLEQGTPPTNVHLFMKHLRASEADFYPHFGTLEALSEYTMQQVIRSTRTTLEKDSDYAEYQTKDQLLAFYFTLVQNLNLSRSYFSSLYQTKGDCVEKIKQYRILRKEFLDYIATLKLESFELPFKKLEKVHAKTKHELAWLQFVAIFKFWLDDSSAGMEQTDVFIEKSVSTGFAIAEALPIKQIVDLGKFLFHAKHGS